MKRVLLSLVFLYFFGGICFAHSTYNKKQPSNSSDTTTRLLDLAVASSPYLKGLNYTPTFTIYNNTLFVFNENKLVQIDLQNGAVSLNKAVTDFLKKLPEDKRSVSQMVVTENEYYLTTYNDLYRITKAGEATKIYSMPDYIEGIYVSKDKFIVSSLKAVELISKNGKRLGGAWPFSGLDPLEPVKGENGLYQTKDERDSVLEFKIKGEQDVSINRYSPVAGLTTITEPYLTYVSDKYFFVFSYVKRNAIYLIKKDLNKNEVYKTIAVKGASLTPPKAQLMDEEGTPYFQLDCSNNVYYIFAIIKGRLKVLSFTV